MPTPRAIELNLKFRRTIKDDRKKNDDPYIASNMSEGTDYANAGQLNNDEISDLTTEAINNYLRASVLQKVRLIQMRRRNVYSFEELAIDFPEYTFLTTFPINLGLVNTVVGATPEDYIYFVSASGPHIGANQENYRYVTPYTIDRLRSSIYDEDRVAPYIYLESFQGGSVQVKVFRPIATSSAGQGTLSFHYIGKQRDIKLDSVEALINSFHDSAIVQEMVRLFENKERLTE